MEGSGSSKRCNESLKDILTVQSLLFVRPASFSRLIRMLIVLALLIISVPARSEWTYDGFWTIDKNDALCEAIRTRLNKYAWKGDIDDLWCAWGVVASYPGFKEPPWQDLDPRKHEELIAKLMKYRLCGPEGYFGERPCRYTDETYPEEARRFIKEGGRLQLWRTELIKGNPVDGPVPPPPQTVVQLRWKWNLTKESERCPGKPVVDWWGGGLYIVTDDLSGPHPALRTWPVGYLMSRSVFFFSGKLHYVEGHDQVLIGADYDGMPGTSCVLEYKETKRRKP
jgi:hypothetical protein